MDRSYKGLSQKPDIVHNISIKPVLYGTIAARVCGVRKIINLINGLGFVFNDEKGLTRKILRSFVTTNYKFIFKRKNINLIFQNPDDQEFFLDHNFCSRKQAHLILGSGVNTQKFKYSYKEKEKLTFALISRMIWEKGIKELVTASEKLKDQGYHFELLFIGEPDKKILLMSLLITWERWRRKV